MSNLFRVGDELPPLKHTATPLQLFRYSAVTWNPHRIHFDEPYAREEGHAGIALHSHLRAALALRCVTEGLGTGWHVAKVAYRLRKPVYAAADVAYTARVSGRQRKHDARTHRAAPLRRGGVRRDGSGQQD